MPHVFSNNSTAKLTTDGQTAPWATGRPARAFGWLLGFSSGISSGNFKQSHFKQFEIPLANLLGARTPAD